MKQLGRCRKGFNRKKNSVYNGSVAYGDVILHMETLSAKQEWKCTNVQKFNNDGHFGSRTKR
jgi:hypothetical protein